MISLWEKKILQLPAAAQKLSVGVAQKKRKFDCRTFIKEPMVLKGSEFYKHIPSLCLYKCFLCCSLSYTLTLCVKMSSDMKISYFLDEAVPAHHIFTLYVCV